MNNEDNLKEDDGKEDVTLNQDINRYKQGFLVKCPMYCRINCANKHHPLLVALLNCKDSQNIVDTNRRVHELKHVVMRYEDTGKWQKDDPIPDSNEGYRYPIIHWAAALGMVNALKWLINHGMSTLVHAEKFGNETCLQKSLLCLQETCPNECYDKFEYIIELMDSSLLEVDNFGSTVAHTCAEYMANDIPKFQYFQHCLFSIIFHLRSTNKETQLHQLMEMQNSEGNTVLHILCRNDKCGLLVRSILREIMPQNQVITVMRNAKDRRAVDIARIWGCPRIYRFLTRLPYCQNVDLDSDDDADLKIYPPPGATGKPIHPMNAVYDRKGNLIGEKLPPVAPVAKTLSVVYDKKGNVIGEKLDVPSVLETDKDDEVDDPESFWSSVKVISKVKKDNVPDEPVSKRKKRFEDDKKDPRKKESEWMTNVKKKYPASHKGFCGHFMPLFDKHLFCLTCRDNKRGDDPCISGKECTACIMLKETEKESRYSMYGTVITSNKNLDMSQASQARNKEIASDNFSIKGSEPGTSKGVWTDDNAIVLKDKVCEESAASDSPKKTLPSTSPNNSCSDEQKSTTIDPQSSFNAPQGLSAGLTYRRTLQSSSRSVIETQNMYRLKTAVTQSKTPAEFISSLREAIVGKTPWTPAVFSYAPMTESEFEEIRSLLTLCSPELKTDIAFTLNQDNISLRRRLAVVETTEEELSNKYEDLQDGQMKLVIEVQKLLHKVNRLRKEEKNLMDAINLINGEINTTHTTHHGLKERLLHCRAALNVLHEIYDEHESNESDSSG